jgi:hypothetical protein
MQQGVPTGALKLWRMGLEKIEPFGPVFCGIDIAFLAGAVRANLTELEADPHQTVGTIVPPSIRLLT